MWESVNKSLFSSSTRLVLGWYPFLKSVMPLYTSDSFEFTVIFKFLNFRFQIFHLVVLEMSTTLTSYIA
jgi:hypothetical protein